MNFQNTINRFRLVVRSAAAAVAVALPMSVAHVVPVAAASPEAPRAPAEHYVLPFSTLEGRPDRLTESDLGYWLWQDGDGLHLRTTTRGRLHVFSGTIRTPEGGAVYAAHLVRDEHRPGNRDGAIRIDHDAVRFRFMTYDGVDGIDFRIAGPVFCIDLHDGGRDAEDITYLGRGELRPESVPVCFER